MSRPNRCSKVKRVVVRLGRFELARGQRRLDAARAGQHAAGAGEQVDAAEVFAQRTFGLSRLSVPGTTRPRFGFDGLKRPSGKSGKRRLPKPPAVFTVTKVGKTLRDWLMTAPRT